MEADKEDIATALSIANDAVLHTGRDSIGMTPEAWLAWDPTLTHRWSRLSDAPSADHVREVKNNGGWCHIPDVLLDRRPPRVVRPVHGIMVHGGAPVPILAIEIDGGVHDARATRTAERNADYERAGLAHIVVNKADCRARDVMWGHELFLAIREVLK